MIVFNAINGIFWGTVYVKCKIITTIESFQLRPASSLIYPHHVVTVSQELNQIKL